MNEQPRCRRCGTSTVTNPNDLCAGCLTHGVTKTANDVKAGNFRETTRLGDETPAAPSAPLRERELRN